MYDIDIYYIIYIYVQSPSFASLHTLYLISSHYHNYVLLKNGQLIEIQDINRNINWDTLRQQQTQI